MARDFKHASIVEGVRFTAQVGVPNVAQGLFRKREAIVSAVGKLPADALAFRLTQGLARKYGPDPFWVRVATDETLLVTHPDDLKIVLGGSPSPFAADPEAKRKGMSGFQPTALTISRGDLWANRRAFAEAVLDTSRPLHRRAKAFVAIALEEADALPGEFGFEEIHDAFTRITRRVVLGEAAADDVELTAQLGALMSASNKLPGSPVKGYDDFHARLSAYVADPDPQALTGLVAKAPHDDDTDVPGQLIHWLFAMGDTLPANLARALALLATHPEQLAGVREELAGKNLVARNIAAADYLAGCLQEAMRLWPTTALFGRELVEDFRWPNGEKTPAGTQLLVHNLFNHRNPERVPYADRFAPEEWVSGDAAGRWDFNFFSHGPQGCPGAGLAIFLGQAFLARLVLDRSPKLVAGATLTPGRKLPYALDVYGLRFGLPA